MRVRLKQVASVRPSNVDKKEVDGQEPVQLCNYTDVYYQEYITPGLKFMSATATRDQVASFELQRGDVLITKDSETADDIAVPALVTEDLFGVLCGYHLALVRPNPEAVDPRFLYRALSSDYVNRQFEVGATGVTRHGLRTDVIRSVRVPLPPLEIQKLIADFLDRETHRIDALIDAKRRMIELLDEKRKAVITVLVTDSPENGQRQPSHDPFIPSLPENWAMASFLSVVDIAEGQVDPTRSPWSDMVLIAPNHIESGTGRITNKQTATEQGAISGKYLCRAGDLIYSKIRPALRKAAIAESDCLCSADMYPLTPKSSLSVEYLKWWFLADPFSRWAENESDRVAMPKINRESLKLARLPIPPLTEQRLIADRIDRETSTMSRILDLLQHQLDLLAEYRQALITQAVTGQLDDVTLKGDKPVDEAVGVIPE